MMKILVAIRTTRDKIGHMCTCQTPYLEYNGRSGLKQQSQHRYSQYVDDVFSAVVMVCVKELGNDAAHKTR